MKRRSNSIPWLALAALVLLSGCAEMMGGLRRDTDAPDWDQPTYGGVWAERGLLAGDGGRGPASEGGPRGYDGAAERDWVTEGQRETAQVDRYSGTGSATFGTTYSGNPNLPPSARRMYKQGSRATRADFMDEGSGEGSLWASDGQTNYYFTKNKIRSTGDIVTVQVEGGLLKDVHAEIARTLSQGERDLEVADAQTRLERPAPAAAGDRIATTASGPDREPAAAKDPVAARKATLNDIDVAPSVELKEKDVIMAEIMERYPNGNYKLRGTKRVRYRNGFRLLTLLGVARSVDITEEDTIASGKLYEYRLEVIR